jgi:hypothetical protein
VNLHSDFLIRLHEVVLSRNLALVGTDVSVECFASIFRVTRIGELGTTLAVSSDRRKLRRNINVEGMRF